MLKIGFSSSIFLSMWPSNLRDDLEKQYGTSSVLHQALCIISNPLVIQTAVTVKKRSICVKIGDFLSCVTLKFDGWTWQTIEHLFYATSSFINHFKAIGEFKLEWQSGNAQFRSKSAIFVPCDLEISRMTLKNNRTPLRSYAASRFEHHFIAICEFELEFQSENPIFGSKLKFDG